MTARLFGYDVRSGRARTRPSSVAIPNKLVDVLDPANLFVVKERMRRGNGQAPGVDGIRYPDLSVGEWFQLFRDLRDDVLAKRYHPQPARTVDIPKLTGGTRTLKLPTVADRVLAKAVSNALETQAEKVFLGCSYGFRPNLDRLDLLADLTMYMEATNHRVITADDVRTAFDAVPVTRVMVNVRQPGADPGLAELAQTILRGHQLLEVGIQQGCPLSPLVLNVLLHHVLDLPMSVIRSGHHPVRYYRYADNVLVVTETAAEGRELLERMRTLLSEAGLTLKGDPGDPRDLTHDDRLALLGTSLTRQQDRLRFQVPNKLWDDLQTKLVNTHSEPDPHQTARATVLGWLRGHSLTFGTNTDEEFRNRLLNLLRRNGHRDVITRMDLSRRMEAARRSWDDRLSRRSRLRGG